MFFWKEDDEKIIGFSFSSWLDPSCSSGNLVSAQGKKDLALLLRAFMKMLNASKAK
jgi:hypothetical protein